MDAKQQEKVLIIRRERQYRSRGVAFFILFFAIPAGIMGLLFWKSIQYTPLSDTFASFLLVSIIIGVSIGIVAIINIVLYWLLLGFHGRETERLKRNWLLRYGSEMFAQVTEHKIEVKEDSEGVRTSTYFLLLTWQDPRTEQPISIKEQTTQDGLARYPIGSRLPVRYDSDDTTFYAVALLSAGV